MYRRRVLISTGTILSFVGCLSDTPVRNDGGTDTLITGDTAFVIGPVTEDVNPHGLTVRNDGGTSRIVQLRIRDAETAESLLEETYTLDNGTEIRGELRGPDAYQVRVNPKNVGMEHVTIVDYFDTCNEYGTIVTIPANGPITSETLTTDLECTL